MANINEFYFGSDWEQSSGPIITRQVPTSDLWPHDAASEIGGGAKDVLADGLHPILAIGVKANRSHGTQCGVVVSFNLTALLAEINTAQGMIVRQYVSNITAYNFGGGGAPNAWAANYNIGMPVYLDDSADLSSGVTLSLSAHNSANSENPLVGYLMPAQDEYLDSGIGGPNIAAHWPVAGNNQAAVETLLTVMLR